MCEDGKHCLIWTWIGPRYLLVCIIGGCGYIAAGA